MYRRCERCVMDNSDPNIIFDSNGFCNHCNDFFNKISNEIYNGEESDKKLKNIITLIKSKGINHKYDSIIGVSGGVDSIYLCYLAKHWGLNPLAVHMDNGWNARVAVLNIKKALDILGIDLYTVVLNWEEFKDLQLSFLKASVPEAENPTDMAIQGVLHKIAAKHKIKFILSGGNYATEGILPKRFQYNPKDLKYLNSIHKKFGKVKLKDFPAFGFIQETYYKLFKKIKILYPLNLVPYNKKEAVKILEDKLAWENYGGKHHESIYTKFIQSYYLPVKFNIDYRKATYSTQICAGEIIRDDALAILKIPPYNSLELEKDKEYLSKKLAINIVELDSILNLPPKTYKDYPNDEKRLEFIYKMYFLLYKK